MSQRVAFKHLVGVAALLVISACVPRLQAPSTPAQPPSQAEPEVDPEGPVAGRVGVLLPLTGDAARFGEDLMLAMTMAVQRLNDERFELVLRDTAGTQEGAIQGAEELIEENVSIILGPLYGTNTGAVAPIAREAGIPVLSLSNQARFAGDGVFALGYGPEEQVERVTAYAVTQGYTQIAALASDDTYGQKAIDGFNRQINRQFGTEITGLAFYPTDQSTGGGSQATADVVRRIAEFDSRKAVVDQERERLEALGTEEAEAELDRLEGIDTRDPPPFSAILLADMGVRLRSVAALLPFYDVDPVVTQVLGVQPWQDDPEVLSETALQGAWIAGLPPDNVVQFENDFENRFGRRPFTLALLAYDATAIALQASLVPPEQRLDRLTDPAGFSGTAGAIRLLADGSTQHGLAILEVSRGGVRIVEPSPASFRDRPLPEPEPAS